MQSMALTSTSSSWFTNWHPPQTVFHQVKELPHYDPFALLHYDDVPFTYSQDGKRAKQSNLPSSQSSNMNKFLPYFLTLGILNGQDIPTVNILQSQPTQVAAMDEEVTGPFNTVYAWKTVEFKFDSKVERANAIASGGFKPDNNLPLGVEVAKDRMFVSFPKWKDGVPATLTVIPKTRKDNNLSPEFVPYPNWEWHKTGSCMGLTSVYRMQADKCDRLWVMDSGQIDVTIKPKQVCPPALFVFNLKTDGLILRYPMPDAFIKQDSLYTNIKVDIRDDKCEDAYAYMTDVWRFGLVVFSLSRRRSWRVTDHLFYPDPLAAAYNLHDLDFEWTDGIFGMALSPTSKENSERILYFHPMSSFREFYVHTSIIRNETGWSDVKDAFKVMGQSRGTNGQTSASAMDRNGILFFNMVTRDSVGCWDSRKPYKRLNLGITATSNASLLFPNDLKIDNEKRQSVWVLSNRLPTYLYSNLDSKQYNFRVLRAYTDQAIKDTICDPTLAYEHSYEHFVDEEDCYSKV